MGKLEHNIILMEDIGKISSNLILDTDSGIWHSPADTNISFPLDHQNTLLGIEENSFWFIHRNRCLSAILNNFPPHGTLFDIGGGNGYVSKGLHDMGFKCVLVEPGMDGAVNAKRHGVDTVICSSFQDSGFQDRSLSAVGMFDVLEHIENENEILNTVVSKLRNGGMIYLSVPAYNWLWSQEDIFAQHYRRYSISSLRKLLAKYDCEILFMSYMFFFLPFPILLFRTIPSKLRIRKTHNINTTIKEHASSSKGSPNIIKKLLEYEYCRIMGRRSMAFGSSIVVAARLKN